MGSIPTPGIRTYSVIHNANGSKWEQIWEQIAPVASKLATIVADFAAGLKRADAKRT